MSYLHNYPLICQHNSVIHSLMVYRTLLTVDCTLNNHVPRIEGIWRGGGGISLWEETVLVRFALKERDVFCFRNPAVLVLKMVHCLSYSCGRQESGPEFQFTCVLLSVIPGMPTRF
jgi:hypothetical protein